AYVAIGRLIRQAELSPAVIGGAALLASVQFFVLTNFASWLVDMSSAKPLYSPTLDGLGACFLAGIPFYKNTLAGDLLYSALIFGAHAGLLWVLRRPAAAPLADAGPRLRPAARPHGIARRDEVRR